MLDPTMPPPMIMTSGDFKKNSLLACLESAFIDSTTDAFCTLNSRILESSNSCILVFMTEAPGRVRNLAPPPTFATAEEERRHRKVHLAGAFRLFARFG